MDQFDNSINKRIISGNFPDEKLLPGKNKELIRLNLQDLAKNALHIFQTESVETCVVFKMLNDRVTEIESINTPHAFEQKVNILINMGMNPDDVAAYPTLFANAMDLNPVITRLDKICWLGAFTYDLDTKIEVSDDNRIEKSMLYAWLYLFELCQNKELRYGLTIDIDAIPLDVDIVNILLSDWEENAWTIKMDADDIVKMENLKKRRAELYGKICSTENDVALKTEGQWSLFIDILNDLGEKEADTINELLSAGTKREKINTINKYERIIDDIIRGKYILEGREISILYILDGVSQRFQEAPLFCTVRTETTDDFVLNIIAISLIIEPITFNYLFIEFHKFRMEPRKENAEKFFLIALKALKHNLGVNYDVDKKYTIDDIIKDFTETISSFVSKYDSYINRIDFTKIQRESVSNAEMHSYIISDDMHKKYLHDVIESIDYNQFFVENIDNILKGKHNIKPIKDLKAEVALVEAELSDIDKTAMAAQIVFSLNMIYMFTDAIRICLNNKHANIKIKKREYAEDCRKKLLRIDDNLIHRVYRNLSDDEMGMLEYREKIGIDYSNLSDQEMQEERYKDALFSDVLKDAISRLAQNIESESIERIFETKSRIRSEILSFPECDAKDLYAEWLDDISNRISDALINKCKNKYDDYDIMKQYLKDTMGSSSSKIPEATYDSLTTAELLFNRYAKSDYAEAGFDYSSISALYYQAFETAYNKLIWIDYANMLNALKFDGVSYTDILDMYKGKGIGEKQARGYLDQDPKQRSYYVAKINSKTQVSLRCMYKSFAIIMENVHSGSKLDKYCDYIAEICGFKDRAAMFNDQGFMQKISTFGSDIDRSSINRNNASHGGSIISREQCEKDKEIVLNNLDTVKNGTLGLIKQLLNILENQREDV